MVENPEPNLRPTTLRPPTHMERDHPSTNPVGVHSPILMSDPNPSPGNPSTITPGSEISRNTIPVPVRSKQRVSSTIDPQPKKRQKVSNPSDTPVSRANDTATPGPLPIATEAVINSLNSDDSDGDGASTAASVHDTETNYAHRDVATSHVAIPPGTSAITLTPNPKAPASPPTRILQPNPMDPPRAPPFRPWTTADDSRADEYETGHKVPSFLEIDRCQTPSRPSGMQVEMGHPETNLGNFRPTWSRQSTPRT